MSEQELLPISGQAVADMFGKTLDGEAWVVLIELAEPLHEIAFVAAVEPEVVHLSSERPTGIAVMLIETPYGFVLRFSFTLIDRPAEPFQLRLPVNPAADAAAPLLSRLAEQETVQIVFFDAVTGEGIARRILRLDLELRESLQQSIELAKDRPSNITLWLQAVQAASDLL